MVEVLSIERQINDLRGHPNAESGLLELDFPELDEKFGRRQQGKVRDFWNIDGLRIMITTDRQSAKDRIVATVPGKGEPLNLTTERWNQIAAEEHLVKTAMIGVPHPNVMVVENITNRLPVEVVVRRFMARSSTSTSIYHNYEDLGRRNIYGIQFPDGLRANEAFPADLGVREGVGQNGVIITPTTKGEAGEHDEMITDKDARILVDDRYGYGVWDKTKDVAFRLFHKGVELYGKAGLLLVDTKYEFGIDHHENVVLIDEVHTPDSSRFWFKESYTERLKRGVLPESFDKEVLRDHLTTLGFDGSGPLPRVDQQVLAQMARTYRVPYQLLFNEDLLTDIADPDEIRQSIAQFVGI